MKIKIGERLKRYRIDHNLTQSKMADTLKVSIATYNALENGKQNVNTQTVDKIARLLEIDVKKVRNLL